MRRTISALTLSFLWLALAGNSGAATPKETKAAIATLASHLVSPTGDDQVDAQLVSHGFPQALIDAQPGWRQFSATRKLDYAARAAEQGQAGGAQQFLARLSSALAQQYQPIQHDSAIQAVITEAPITANTLVFRSPAGSTPPPVLRPQVRHAIAALQGYLSNGSYNVDWAVNVMVKDPDRAYEILVHSDTVETALTRAYHGVIGASRHERLAEVIAQVCERSEVARNDAAFQRYLATTQSPRASATAERAGKPSGSDGKSGKTTQSSASSDSSTPPRPAGPTQSAAPLVVRPVAPVVPTPPVITRQPERPSGMCTYRVRWCSRGGCGPWHTEQRPCR